MQSINLPQKLATAFLEVTSSLAGATYIHVLYCDQQIVHGLNHMIICVQTTSIDHIIMQSEKKDLIAMVINISEQGSSIVEIKQII